MHGPVWNDPNVGVTGEPKFRTTPANYVTYTDHLGRKITLVGDAADRYRASQES